jgi:hypothetical protein
MVSKLLKYLPRKAAALIVVSLLLVLAVNFTWAKSVTSSKASREKEVATAQAEVTALRARLSAIRADGVVGLSALLTRLERLESVLPFAIDTIEVAAQINALAESSGVLLEDLNAVTEKGATAPSGTNLGAFRGYTYSFSVSGSYAAITNFIDNMISSDQVVITVSVLELSGKGGAAQGSEGGSFGSTAVASGQLVIWALNEQPLTTSEPNDLNIAQPAPAPSDAQPAPVVPESPDAPAAPEAPLTPDAPAAPDDGAQSPAQPDEGSPDPVPPSEDTQPSTPDNSVPPAGN